VPSIGIVVLCILAMIHCIPYGSMLYVMTVGDSLPVSCSS